ncbi:ATP synthase F1 subunit gamma [Gluconobacter thailandicus F149-1 = NBRC 100600]|uniref:ATP synthase gamma chain n=2 Tax=Gluconobacter thailandicus TaxID=257438 RepID=A0AAJ0VGZ7_GLUTH|nr:F0F1 ATP synthase subunit gamma [Gluconobacter thailandicus]KXV33801.1 ATP synthase F0F1 subunit gamma [Gluconobacter thailandicus]KXV52605.1 ATP synthase F0F1 subunit gamma [Gluconobacter thailandicus]QEH96049.1 F0F1 ATP synthase subunit gamma [Gluconobacter thailandicus]GAC88015.1 ATP synthase F0F1 subunit gamma [Gluconobacter thailandicus NBRC 3255]GAD26684.1 ATP synthase F0F1 subunit gamma [Gluconobacter thailandicus NBRC 3257]
MPSLKELRGRITGVKSTRKITNAMKMVAASKLRRAQSQAEAARPYAEAMGRMMAELAAASRGSDASSLPKLLAGTGKDQVHLLVILTSDRGLAGGFNANIVRSARQLIRTLQDEGRTVRLLPVGRKGADILAKEYPDLMVERVAGTEGRDVGFDKAEYVGKKIVSMLEAGEIDRCTLIYNRFVNAMSQIAIQLPLVPLSVAENDNVDTSADAAQYEFEPDEATLLASLLPRNLQVQIFSALLESAAGEQGARMTAMDNASRNASKAIDRLSQKYNRTRQANITNELIEIISGAEAV